MFLPNKTIKNLKFNYSSKQYVGDVVMFLPNKIIKIKNFNYSPK